MKGLIRLGAVARKEFIQVLRDRLTLAIMVGIPAIQLTLFGFAINTNVYHIRTVVCDLSHSSAAIDLVNKLTATTTFDITHRVSTYADAKRLIDQEEVKTAILIPPDYARNLVRGAAQVGVLVDASDPLLASSALSTASQVGLMMSTDILRNQFPGGAPPAQPLEMRVQALYNPDLRSANYIVPGLIGVILTLTMVLVTATAIVRERERGTMEALVATPVTKIELMVGKILPYVCIGYIQMTIVMLIAGAMFGIWPVGNPLVLYGVGFLFIVASLGVGLVISTIAKTQIQAMQMSFFFFLPNILLSGFMFPVSSMPFIIQKISACLPLSYFLVVLRGVVLKGTGVADLWGHIWPLLIFAPATVTIGVLKFSKKLS